MKHPVAVSLICLLLAASALAQMPSAPAAPQAGSAPTPAPAAPPRTISAVLDRALSGIERNLVGAAEAMPEDKYNFAPTSGEFKGVRTFAQQVRHAALTNHQVFSAILGQPAPDGGPDDNGPALKTKAEIVQYLRDSFALGHKALATVNESNIVSEVKNPFGGKNPVTPLGMALIGVSHSFNHYGQIVEYLRMNGIVPPASR